MVRTFILGYIVSLGISYQSSVIFYYPINKTFR